MCVAENSHNSIKPRQSMLCRGESLEGICEKKDGCGERLGWSYVAF